MARRRRLALMAAAPAGPHLTQQLAPLPRPGIKHTIRLDPDTEKACLTEYEALVAWNATKDPPLKTPPIDEVMPSWIEMGLSMARKLRDGPPLIQPVGGRILISPYLTPTAPTR